MDMHIRQWNVLCEQNIANFIYMHKFKCIIVKTLDQMNECFSIKNVVNNILKLTRFQKRKKLKPGT